MTDANAGSDRHTTPTAAEWGTRGTAGVSFASGLTFNDVVVRFGHKTILDNLNLSLTPGEIVCLLGESGSGKSTILRVAAGIQSLNSGTVRINNTVVSAQNYQIPPSERGVGLMFQDFALFPHLTIIENATFGLSGLDKTATLKRANAALERVGLAGRENDFPHMLSGGQQQRLALARTIAPRPGIIMLDEPFSGLDARMRETVRGETLAVLRETNATSLIVTHDPEEAMLLGDRVALLRKGKILQIDNADTIYQQPKDLPAARFLSSLTEISCTVASGEVATPLGIVKTPGRQDGTKVIVGIRPIGDVHFSQKAPGILGRIVSKRSALGVDICEVLVEGVERPVRVRQATDHGFKVGNDVFLRFNPEHVLVFDQD